ncbi:hypothetical protein LCM20_09075 [Halobacillus litoralis]|uniref:hypothetical protein n=1 Tax=Halobacillus litoralis TaxID=45668 RepID=UPI001CD3129F|nr:hypothetical protein [Halobacillus litoralis]MCA0970739.1 hypothetical protein [Halobacillus litoralis]
MNKMMTVFILILALIGCQPNTPEPEFTLGNYYPSQMAPNETYTIVVPFEWEGEEELTLKSMVPVAEGEPSVDAAFQPAFYIGESTKRTGIYSRQEIGERTEVEGYPVQNEQTLIMQWTAPDDATNQTYNLQITYESGGEEYQKEVEWGTLTEVMSDEVISAPKKATPLEEKPNFVLTLDGEEVPFQVIEECWAEDCSEDESFLSEPVIDLEVEEMTEDLEPVPVSSGDFLEITVEGEEPELIEYKRLVDSIFIEERLNDSAIELYKEGTHHFLFTALWYDEDMLFQGSKTIGVVFKVGD